MPKKKRFIAKGNITKNSLNVKSPTKHIDGTPQKSLLYNHIL